MGIDITRPQDMIVMPIVVENDGENPDDVEARLLRLAREVLDDDLFAREITHRVRVLLVNRLTGINIQRARRGLLEDPDDVLGRLQEVRISQEDVAALNPFLAFDRTLEFREHGGHYRLTFEIASSYFGLYYASRGLMLNNHDTRRHRIVQIDGLRILGDGDVGGAGNVTTFQRHRATSATEEAERCLWDSEQVSICHNVTVQTTDWHLDTHEVESQRFQAVTRRSQGDDTQKWVLMPQPDGKHVTIQQLSGLRYLAAGLPSADQSVVTKGAADGTPEPWELLPDVNGRNPVPMVHLRHQPTGKYLRAIGEAPNLTMVLSDAIDGWATFQLDPVGSIMRVKNVATGRFLDALETDTDGHNVFTQGRQDDQTQLWLYTIYDGVLFNIRQLSSRRYLDAHQVDVVDGRDWFHSAVMREDQQDNTQRWYLA